MQIVIKRQDGGVSIMGLHSSTYDLVRTAGPLADTIIELEISKSGLAGIVSWRVFADDAIPTDRTFRNAWCDVTPAFVIDIDMPKAREIHRDRLRQARAPLLKALDADYMRAFEVGDIKTMSDVVAKKNALRDVTDDPAIAAAATPDALKAVIPAALKEATSELGNNVSATGNRA
jgi:hypothetical protein